MKNFIEVTKGTQKLMININYIQSYYVGVGCTSASIMMFDGRVIDVREKMSEVTEKIKKAQTAGD